jgi:hypothetical protein
VTSCSHCGGACIFRRELPWDAGAASPGVAAVPFVARRRRGYGPWPVPPWATALSLHTGTHRDIILPTCGPSCAVAAMTARGHGNDGESPGNTCHMTTGRGVLYPFFSWPLPFSPYWLLAGRAGQRRVSGTDCGDSRRTRVLLCVRSGSRPSGPRRQIARPRCLCAPPARRGSRVGKWPVNCRHEPEGGRYRDRRLIGSHLCGTEIARHGLGFAISGMRRQPQAIPEISARIQRPGDQAPRHFATRSRASRGRHQNRSKTK